MQFPEDYEGYDHWFLPKELTSLVPEKMSNHELDIYPILIKFSPNNDKTYKLTYQLYCEGNEPIEDIEVSIDNLLLKDVKNIMKKSLYELLIATDHIDTTYLFYDHEPYGSWVADSKYYNFIKFTRIGMRDTLQYLRKK
jgi:hypothetical protein